MSAGYKTADYFIAPNYAVSVDPTHGLVDPSIALVILGSIVAERATQAIIEEGRRLDRQECVLNEALRGSKDNSEVELDHLTTFLGAASGNLLAHDNAALTATIQSLKAALANARTHSEIARHAAEVKHAEMSIHRAIRRKELADSQSRGVASEHRRVRFGGLKERFAGIPGPDGGDGPMDPQGAQAVRRAIAQAAAVLQGHDEARQERALDALEAAVETHENVVTDAINRKALLASYVTETQVQLNALFAGLQVDDVVMRWQAREVEQLAAQAATIKAEALTSADSVTEIVNNAKEAAAAIVHTANVAQIKADQRDYVARSIGAVLSEMGYIAADPVAEHPDHPATAMIVQGQSPSGRSISVSVPFEGQVWYNVDGFVKTIEAAVGGGTAAVCDEAEEVITQMHDALEEQYHVQMGELMWEGKDPNRILRQARSHADRAASERSN